MKVQYIIFMLIFFMIFVVVSAALIPFAYVIGMVVKLSAYKQSDSIYDKITKNFIFIPLGLPILCLDLVSDLFYFWKNNFRLK
jgi:hypothetical protein